MLFDVLVAVIWHVMGKVIRQQAGTEKDGVAEQRDLGKALENNFKETLMYKSWGTTGGRVLLGWLVKPRLLVPQPR